MNRPRKLVLVGIGPGDLAQLTVVATEALAQAEVVVGYTFYVDLIGGILSENVEILASPIGSELDRARMAIESAKSGKRTVLISSGDIGIYGMAAPVFDLLREAGWTGSDPEIELLPGISAFQAAAARLGAPFGHDFCLISLSDLLTPWAVIERRVRAAGWGDFVVAFYNPRSRARDWQLRRACALLAPHRAAATPVAIVRNVSRPDEAAILTTFAAIDYRNVDMFSLVVVGNSQTYRVADRMATPRGYLAVEQPAGAHTPSDSPNTTYPVVLSQIRGAKAVVVGGGKVAERKVIGLLAAGAVVRLISPNATPALRRLSNEGRIAWQVGEFFDGGLAGASICVAATDSRSVNVQVAAEAASLGILCNVADAPDEGTFHLPAVLRSKGLTIAVSTGGSSPARATAVRDQIAEWLAHEPSVDGG